MKIMTIDALQQLCHFEWVEESIIATAAKEYSAKDYQVCLQW